MPTDPRTPDDALRAIEARLERAAGAAEELIAEAAARLASPEPETTPPGGWHAPTPDPAAREDTRDRDLELLMTLARRLRELLPIELQQRLAAALRELLMALRALVDWCLERVERRAQQPPEVRDIPIR